MTIFILIALTLPAYFMITGLVEVGHMKPNKFTKYVGINAITGKQLYNGEDYYG